MIAEPESRFTAATALCPNPQRWTSTDDESTEVEVSAMVYGLIRGLQPGLCIETGTAWGQTTQFIGEALKENGHGRLVSLEIDPEKVRHSQELCQGLPVDIIVSPAIDYQPDGVVEFVFFDSHYNQRVPEYLHYRQWMRTGTVVVFHDSAPGHGVGAFPNGWDMRTAIDDLGIDVIHLPTPRGVSIGVVR